MQWEAPDASILGDMGIGVVMRDSDGNAILCADVQMVGVWEVRCVEAKAIKPY